MKLPLATIGSERALDEGESNATEATEALVSTVPVQERLMSEYGQSQNYLANSVLWA